MTIKIRRRNPTKIKTYRVSRETAEESVDDTISMVEAYIQDAHDREANDKFVNEWSHDHHCFNTAEDFS